MTQADLAGADLAGVDLASSDLAPADPTKAEVKVVTVLMTAPDAKSAEAIVRQLLEERLVACGNILPGAVSLYRWKGRIQRDEEVVVILKARADLVSRVLERAPQLHSYEVPELLVHEVDDGSAPYLEWVRQSCREEMEPTG